MKLKKSQICTVALTTILTCSSFVAYGASYQYGDKGGEVPAIQKKLIDKGYKARLNGEYDKDTKWAVRLFQKDKGLTVDGIVGAVTYKKLMGKDIPKNDKVTERVRTTKKEDSRKQEVTKHKNNDFDAALEGDLEYSGMSYATASKEIKGMIDYAHKFRGVPYVFGGNTPKGFDCSGYTKYVFAKVGVTLPRMADEQYRVGKKVSRSQLKPGDLVFFETYEPGISHSGIYIGEGKFISATSSRGVAVDSLMDGYWGKRYRGATRVLK